MALDKYDFSADEVKSRLHALFEGAKGCGRIRVRLHAPARARDRECRVDPFDETHQLVEDLMTLASAPLVPYTRVRLGLLLYSHLTEVGAMYEVLANLTRVVAGERYVIDPFNDHYPRNLSHDESSRYGDVASLIGGAARVPTRSSSVSRP